MSPIVRPGDQVAITYLLTGSETISALQWDEDVDGRLSVSERIPGPALDAAGKQLQCAAQRCVAVGFGQNLIGDGAVLTATVSISADADPGRARLRLHRVVAAGPDAAPTELQSGRDFEFTIVEPGAPAVVREAIVNAASYEAGLSPGGLVTIFGADLMDAVGIVEPQLSTTSDGVTVFVNGLPAPLLTLANVNGSEQINVQVPFETPPGLVTVEMDRGGVRTAVDGVNVFAAQPGIFELTGADGVTVPAVTHADGQLVDAARPAGLGEVVSIYFTGGGNVDPLVGTGALGPDEPALITLPVTVIAADAPYSPDFAGYVPRLAGLYQINFDVPETLPPGTSIPLRLDIGGNLSNTVSLPIQ